MTLRDFEEHRQRAHIVKELGFSVELDGDELRGSAAIVPEMFVPGTSVLRTSILACWTDTIAGIRASGTLTDKTPVTLALDIHLHHPPEGLTEVHLTSRLLKAGSSVVAIEVELLSDHGPLGVGTVTFMAAPAPAITLPPMAELVEHSGDGNSRLALPFADRARCERREAGVAAIPLMEDATNASLTLNGGLLALAVEEAALSALPASTLSSLNLHYLRPVRVGPAVARAVGDRDLARVEVTDAGADDRLAVVATVRAFDATTDHW